MPFDHADAPQPSPTTRDKRSNTQLLYSERLMPPLWWWPVGLVVAVLMAAEVQSGLGWLWPPLPYLIVIPLTFALLALMCTSRLRVYADRIRAGQYSFELDQVASVEELDPPHTRTALGRDADPKAWIYARGWVHTSVKIVGRTDDPPYFILTSRQPERLAAAIVAAAAPAAR